MLNQPLLDAQRLVIKLGTQIVIHPPDTCTDGQTGSNLFATERLNGFVADCAKLVAEGREVILVSSGAVGLGRQKLGLTQKLSLTEKQACAAVGQNLLMDAYQALFNQHGLIIAQVLVSAMDFADRRHYLNLRQTLDTLLQLGVVPVINENDSVSTMELRDEDYIKGFGDNDKLSALVAAKLGADLLLILTNVDGIYTENPELNSAAERLAVIENLQELKRIQTVGQSSAGRGGMSSKLEAARLAAISGVHTYIASGLKPGALSELFSPADILSGTLVRPQLSIRGKKQWIGMASGYHGVIIVNEGARNALREKYASLLPVGIIAVEGSFLSNQVISIQDERRMEIGRGLTFFSSSEIEKIKGCPSDAIPERLGANHAMQDRHEVVHRNNLVIFEDYGL